MSTEKQILKTLDSFCRLWYTYFVKKLIPIICIIVASISLATAVVGLILICAAISAEKLAVIAMPLVITGLVLSAMSVGVDGMFFKDKLCRIALFINLAALILSVASVAVWVSSI